MISMSRFTLPLDTLLLIVMTMSHLWFNPVSSAFIVMLLAVYVLLDLFFPLDNIVIAATDSRNRRLFLFRLLIVLFIVLSAAVFPTGLNILHRHAEGPATNANDGLIQTEVSIDMFLHGKNPYTENYFNTVLADWKGGEPPWTPTLGPFYHYPYLPFLFIGSTPFYIIGNEVMGWYDQRFLYLLLYVFFLLLLPWLVQKARDKLSLLIAIGLNFFFTFLLAEGRNDITILLGLVLATFLLAQRRSGMAAVALGLTLGIKHSAWFFLPFYFAYMMPQPLDVQSVRALFRRTWPLYVVTAAIILPFLIWDAPSFFDDTLGYLIGTSGESYPIRGWGISALLIAARVIPTAYSPYPFGIFEVLLGIPVLILLLRRQRRDNTLQQMWFGFAVFSFVVEYFSRFFNDNYLLFILQAFVIASFMITNRWDHMQGSPVESGKLGNVQSLSA